MIANDPMMQAQFQNDPQGAQIQIASMVARRISETYYGTSTSRIYGSTKRSNSCIERKRTRSRAMDLQRKAEQDFNGNEIRENEIDERIDLEKMKLENNEDQAAERIKVAREKLRYKEKSSSTREKIMGTKNKKKKVTLLE
jgi:hypothetical protein